tara:strand:- start:1317 stop:2312 length:996 start_codon:yes stop_codon:yes gene_type:complete
LIDPLSHHLSDLPSSDTWAAKQMSERLDDILRPKGALARLDELAVFMAGWQGLSSPSVNKPKVLIFAGDHGVAQAGVSAYPSEITKSMYSAFESDSSTINALARVAGASVTAVDVGVGRPTDDIRAEPAMSPDRFEEAFQIGRTAVQHCDCDLLALGEMGIGNTTSSAAIAAALFGGDAATWVGRGTGVDEEGMKRKVAAVQTAVTRVGEASPYEILRQLGGTEIVALAGAIVEARKRRIPVVLDGFVVTAASAPLYSCNPKALDHCVVGHQSAETGHQQLLDNLNLQPILNMEFRLGEGSGAAAAIPLISMACAAATEVPTFSEFFEADT